jgi:2-polyprenyl-6-methoxyphenol hydroxylase-like FAD-dependent oxidoreductase
MPDVVVAGAGPAGLMLAAELRVTGVDVVVLERELVRPGYCRGFTLSARSLDLLARRGLAERFLAEGHRVGHAAFSGLPGVVATLAGAHTDHPWTLGIAQTRVEELLEEHVGELGANLRRGHALRAFQQDADGVTVEVDGPDGAYELRAAYLAGCDGSRSVVRKHAGIGFPGTPATRFTLLGDVEQDGDPLPFGVTSGPSGTVFVIPRPGYVRMIVTDPDQSAKDVPATLERLQGAVSAVAGREINLVRPRWVTRFGNAARLAERYRDGRVLLAGDAAHVHPPAGAIGVNVALDDAVNLGWKLAAALRGHPDPLDTYHPERHTAGAQVLAATRAQLLLSGGDDSLDPLRDLLTRVFTHPDGSRALAEVLTALDTRYPTAAGHDWLGRLVPDLVVSTPTGEVTLSDLLRPARGVLLDLIPHGPHARAAAPWSDRLPIVTGSCVAHPGLGAVLIRPDGHAAWLAGAGRSDLDGLTGSLIGWFGPG